MNAQTQRALLYAGLIVLAWYLSRQGILGGVGRLVDPLSGQPITPPEYYIPLGIPELRQQVGGGGFI